MVHLEVGLAHQLRLLDLFANTVLYRKAVLPIEMELGEDRGHGSSESEDDEEKSDMECYIRKMTDFRDTLFKGAKSNIVDAQMKQKSDYDRKHGKSKVHTHFE